MDDNGQIMEVRRTLYSIVEELQGKHLDLDAILGYDPNSGHSLILSSYGLRISGGFPQVVATLFVEFIIKREKERFLFDQRYLFGRVETGGNQYEIMAKDFAKLFGHEYESIETIVETPMSAIGLGYVGHASVRMQIATAHSSTNLPTLEGVKETVLTNFERYASYLRQNRQSLSS